MTIPDTADVSIDNEQSWYQRTVVLHITCSELWPVEYSKSTIFRPTNVTLTYINHLRGWEWESITVSGPQINANGQESAVRRGKQYFVNGSMMPPWLTDYVNTYMPQE